ncbi:MULTISPECIES: Bbp19 family protein [Pandoraea]|uniref:Bbp19 family protein n=1 Tax=Pandoraea cepalis TaxID=2508294 RepID=UPI003F5C34AE
MPQSVVGYSRRRFCGAGVSGHSGTDAHEDRDFAGRRAVLLRILLADAALEQTRHVQAGAGSRDLRGALSARQRRLGISR